MEADREFPGSGRNPKVWVSVSYFQTGTSTSASGNYFILSGTSMATAVVSGGAALLIQKNPSFTPDQVKAVLMKSAFKNLPQVFDRDRFRSDLPPAI
jgi:serine protease AprX